MHKYTHIVHGKNLFFFRLKTNWKTRLKTYFQSGGDGNGSNTESKIDEGIAMGTHRHITGARTNTIVAMYTFFPKYNFIIIRICKSMQHNCLFVYFFFLLFALFDSNIVVVVVVVLVVVVSKCFSVCMTVQTVILYGLFMLCYLV